MNIVTFREKDFLVANQVPILDLLMIIFPLLAITEEEKMTFENEPQEFKYLAEDCCDHQKFGILKTQVSALLETLCDESPQTASYVVQHAILSIKLKISNP